jgi:4-amino-4-deoxy-L-arabinose transferase-like glycosyltransferase
MRRHLPLTGIVLLAGILRLGGLGTRSLWLDEGATWDTVNGSFGHMLRGLVDHEATPPLSYVLDWLGVQAFGTSEFALRLPAALAGIALVPVVYVAGRDLAGRRAGLIAALLAACNPFLVWHAQDARSYSLLVLFVAGTIAALARGRLWWWAAMAIGALLSHYFALFVLIPEGVWLLRSRGRAAWGPIAVAAAPLVPLAVLALSQPNEGASWIAASSIFNRILQVPAGYLVGYQLALAAGVVAGLLVAVPVGLALLRALRDRAGRALVVLALIGIALPILGAAVGHDYLIPRSVIGSLAPLLLAAAIGFDRLRWGVPAAAVVCVVWIAITVATAGDPKFRREDWRAAAAATRGAGAVLVVPGSGERVLRYYRAGSRQADSARVTSIAVLRMGQSSGFGCRIPHAPALPAGATAQASGRCWRVEVHRWPSPHVIVAGDDSLLR